MKKIIVTESQLKKIINIITEDHVILRKLSRKSHLNFGKYSKNPGLDTFPLGEKTVGEILEIQPQYLIWVYYNMHGLSFTNDVLRDLGILTDESDYTIKKPGIDPELGDIVYKKLTDFSFRDTEDYQKWKKNKKKAIDWLGNVSPSKSGLQWDNQGRPKTFAQGGKRK